MLQHHGHRETVGDGPGGAGDAAADRFGNAGMKAMDIADAVANVLKEN